MVITPVDATLGRGGDRSIRGPSIGTTEIDDCAHG